MIKSFKNKGLAQLYGDGDTAEIDKRLHARLLRVLDALNVAQDPRALNIPGLGFHALHGFDPTRYAVSINGPWRVTFEFDQFDAARVDFEQYH